MTSPENASIEVCEINAWCPEELVNSTWVKRNIDEFNLIFVDLSEFILNTNDLDDFTVYLKTVVTFGLFNITLFVLIRILIKKIDVDFVFLGEMFVMILIWLHVDMIKIMIQIVRSFVLVMCWIVFRQIKQLLYTK
jgi:hypothetical protein